MRPMWRFSARRATRLAASSAWLSIHFVLDPIARSLLGEISIQMSLRLPRRNKLRRRVRRCATSRRVVTLLKTEGLSVCWTSSAPPGVSPAARSPRVVTSATTRPPFHFGRNPNGFPKCTTQSREVQHRLDVEPKPAFCHHRLSARDDPINVHRSPEGVKQANASRRINAATAVDGHTDSGHERVGQQEQHGAGHVGRCASSTHQGGRDQLGSFRLAQILGK